MNHDVEVITCTAAGGWCAAPAGYEDNQAWSRDAAVVLRDRHIEIAPLIRGNACRYCFAPLDDPKAWYCDDGCNRADRVRPKADVLAAALEAHRVESFEPGPDQLSMFGEST